MAYANGFSSIKKKLICFTNFLKKITLATALCCASVNAAHAFSIKNAKIVDSNNAEVQLRGVNWFGFQTTTKVVHGLWTRNWKDMLQQIQDSGFNAIRFPVCPSTLQRFTPVSSIDYTKNPDLKGLGSFDILDVVVREADRRGIYILLDHHTPDCSNISELWYTGTYSEAQWLNDLEFMAKSFAGVSHFVGIDIKNEPHGSATWGTGNAATDWNTAAEKAAKRILAVNSNVLIFVEGIQSNPQCSGDFGHWWGGSFEPLKCTPLQIPADKLVLSPHVYGPDVYAQTYFSDPSFPKNMPPIWEQHFGQFIGKYPVIIGEFGGRYGVGGLASDKPWQDALVSYLKSKGVSSGFYWSWNPNSTDTGGILNDDWKTVRKDKLALLSTLWGSNTSTTNTTPPRTPTNPPPTQPPSPPPPPPSSAIKTSFVINDDWVTGYCASVQITGTSSTPVAWQVSLPLQGTINNLWNANWKQVGSSLTASGVSWNNMVTSTKTARFGFCAKR